MDSAKNPTILLYTYDVSIHGRRISWYLALRGLSHVTCPVRNRLPREELEKLNVAYRRIPILAIGRHVYCDTRLILKKLEEVYPESALGATNPFDKGVEALLENWHMDGGTFWRSATLLPPTFPPLNDPKFVEDRAEMTGKKWDARTMESGRKEGLTHMRATFDLIENTFLADGRQWILDTASPTLADMLGIWPLHWLRHPDMDGALPPTPINAQSYPKTYAWIDRFNASLSSCDVNVSEPAQIDGDKALEMIERSAEVHISGKVDPLDPLNLKEDDEVDVWPIDSGFNHRDRGCLKILNVHEVAISKKTVNSQDIVVHFPRTNFRIQAV